MLQQGMTQQRSGSAKQGLLCYESSSAPWKGLRGNERDDKDARVYVSHRRCIVLRSCR